MTDTTKGALDLMALKLADKIEEIAKRSWNGSDARAIHDAAKILRTLRAPPVSGADSGVREALVDLNDLRQWQHDTRVDAATRSIVGKAADEIERLAALASSGNAGALDPFTVEACARAAEGTHSHGGYLAAAAIRALIGQPAPASNAGEAVLLKALKEIEKMVKW